MRRGVIRTVVYIAVGVAVRAALLTDPVQALDGDEALKGLMALNVLRGGFIPFVPYGAAYGLSIFETLFHLAFGAVFGLRPATMQAAMLTFWLIASLLIHAAVRNLISDSAAMTSTLLLVSMPAWVRASYASWGYNISAFFFVALGLFAVSKIVDSDAAKWWIVLGGAAAFAALTQPIGAIALAAFCAPLLPWRHRGIVIAGATAAVPMVLFLIFRPRNPSWNPPIISHPAPLSALWQLPARWEICLSGGYMLDVPFRMIEIGRVTALLWCAALVAVIIAGAVALVRRQRSTIAGCAAAIAGVSAFSLIINPSLFAFRYLLPGTAFVAIGAGALLSAFAARSSSARLATLSAASILVMLGAAAATSLRGYPFSGSDFTTEPTEHEATASLVRTLEQRGIRYVYAKGDTSLPWKLMFAAGGSIAARWRGARDRCPSISRGVDDALYAGEPVAIVGESHNVPALVQSLHEAGWPGPAPIVVGPGYYILLSPREAFLRSNFSLNPPRTSARPALRYPAECRGDG